MLSLVHCKIALDVVYSFVCVCSCMHVFWCMIFWMFVLFSLVLFACVVVFVCCVVLCCVSELIFCKFNKNCKKIAIFFLSELIFSPPEVSNHTNLSPKWQ